MPRRNPKGRNQSRHCGGAEFSRRVRQQLDTDHGAPEVVEDSSSITFEHRLYTVNPDPVARAARQAGHSVRVHADGLTIFADYTTANAAAIVALADRFGAQYGGGGVHVGPLP